MVGASGFEPETFCTPSKRATSLRHAPNSRVNQEVRPKQNKRTLAAAAAWVNAG